MNYFSDFYEDYLDVFVGMDIYGSDIFIFDV